MNEDTWNRWSKPDRLLGFLQHCGSRRKLRLFACACCRRVPEVPTLKHGIDSLDVAERLAEGLATNQERRQANEALARAQPFVPALNAVLESNAWNAARSAAHSTRTSQTKGKIPLRVDGPGSAINPAWEQALQAEEAVQCGLLREIFGPLPFRPVTVASTWLTSTVLALAGQMYETRDGAVMPILADALQDAGCDNADVLDHCRDPSATHVKGCWVLDLLLGKA